MLSRAEQLNLNLNPRRTTNKSSKWASQNLKKTVFFSH